MDAELRVARFGFPGPLRDQLVSAILDGTKTSTTGLVESFVRHGRPLPEVGEREQVVDSADRPVAVIETTEVRVGTKGDVDAAFAVEEGEGFRTVDDWWAAHVAYFTSPQMGEDLGDPAVDVDDTTRLVLLRFRLVKRLD